MMYYSQSTGAFSLGGKVIAKGYAGNGPDKNKPESQGKLGHGPLPRHQYKLGPVVEDRPTGPFTIILTPVGTGDMLGRSAFRIHGDSIARPGAASDGCIILPRNIRDKIWASGERLLTVTA